MTESSAIERLRGEMAELAEDLRTVQIDKFVDHADALERRLPGLLAEVRADPSTAQEQAAADLRGDMLRLGALLETIAVYGRARLALEQRPEDSYGPSGSPRRAPRRGRPQEA